MERLGRIALQGSSRGLLSPLLLFVVLITTSGIPAHAADGQPAACRSPIARVVSIQGTVELLRAGSSNWTRVTRLDAPVCAGDQLRTGTQSRAALFVQPETLVRVDQNTSAIFGQSAEETLVEFTQQEVLPVAASAHACGAGYFITRFPRKFKVRTPHLSAAVEGTEFLVAMRCEATDLSVFEGKVLASSAGTSAFPAQSVVSGQTLTVGRTEPPAIKLLIKPADAVQWTLYYPPITPADATPVEDCSDVTQDRRASCLIARAERLLRAGSVDQAQINIADALAVAPVSSDAKALSSIISLVRNDKVDALRLAKEAVDATPDSASAWLALSYAQQADFKLEAALASAKRAAELTPSNALALARVAELQLSLGWTREAEKTAKRALEANQSESRAHMILGFVHLAQIKVQEAREDFERAIELDSTDPLSRLGLGLTIIRKGNLIEGREQIELAVALDPTNSLLRSYVGKAYYEENTKDRDQLASTEFGLAKQLDPKDPTPWFYDAFLKRAQNRPNEALGDVRQSIERNYDQAIFRSKLSLDEDLAARSTSAARIYQELGFTQLGLTEAAMANTSDPSNFSTHELLSEIYAVRPRHEIARVSELLQSQLRQPLGVTPRGIELADDRANSTRSGTLPEVRPNRIESIDNLPLYYRNNLSLYSEVVAGERKTLGGQITVSGLHDSTFWDIGTLHYETDGFPGLGPQKEDIYDVFGQIRISSETSLQAEMRHLTFERTETFFAFDPAAAFPVGVVENTDNVRLGAYHKLGPHSDLVFSLINQARDIDNFFDGFPQTQTLASTGTTGELQYAGRYGAISIVSGVGKFHSSDRFLLGGFSENLDHENYYLYGGWNEPIPRLHIQIGASVDLMDRDDTSVHRVSPKLGAVWGISDSTTLRAAAFQTIKRQLLGNQTIEPTQVAGFDQFFDDSNGTISRRAGVGLDHRFSTGLYGGVEFSSRKLDVPVFSTSDIEWFRWKEHSNLAYMYWLVPETFTKRVWAGWTAAISADVRYDQVQRPEDFVGAEGFLNLKTWDAPIALNCFIGNGISFRFVANYVHQEGTLLSPINSFPVHDEFWILNFSAEYRIPRRHGRIVLGVSNLTNQTFTFQESDPSNPRFAPERFLYGRFSLDF